MNYSRFATGIGSPFFGETMNLDKSHKYMDSTMNAQENMETVVSGNISQSCLTIFP